MTQANKLAAIANQVAERNAAKVDAQMKEFVKQVMTKAYKIARKGGYYTEIKYPKNFNQSVRYDVEGKLIEMGFTVNAKFKYPNKHIVAIHW